jgi:DNA-binding CsgD family transcriptional regulator
MLLGRRNEREVFDRLFEAVRRGESRVLVVRGEPGVGKSALLEYAVESASGLLIARAAGVESEMELAFAGLHQLFSPMLDHAGALPAPQRDALGTVFGLTGGPAPDRFLLALAVLGLVSEVAEERPLVCLVDDAQWLDQESAQALEFVARRLLAEPVALVFAVRQVREEQPLAGLPELVVEGLRNGDARAVLGSAIRWPLDEHVRDRIIEETRGNPLALLELPRRLTPTEMAGGFGLPDAKALSSRIEDSFQRRVRELPTETQRLLLVAAAEPVGEAALVRRAACRLGIGVEAAHAAESERLVEFGARVTFHHPLVRSAVYRAASPQDRREAHRALAETTDPQLDPDRRAWHLAQATVGPDEEVASELERSAGRAQSRGGLAAAAAFLERSAVLTHDRARRAVRAVAAAAAHAQAGGFDAALRLLETAEVGPLEELQSARADLLRAQIAYSQSRPSDAPALMLKAAKQLEPQDARLARETYLEALAAAQFAGHHARGAGIREVAQAASAAPAPPAPPRTPDLLLDGLVTRFTQGYAAGVPVLQRAVDAFCSESFSDKEELRWLRLAGNVALDLWQFETWEALSTRLVERARDSGALAGLPSALNVRIAVHVLAGELSRAALLIEEVEAITQATGSQLAPYGRMWLAAWQGRTAEASERIDAVLEEEAPEGKGLRLTAARWATSVFYNAVGRYDDALEAAEQASEYLEGLGVSAWGLVELIEAAVRGGERQRAADALERLSQATLPSGTEWGLGIEARSRALLSDDEAAERLYREAIERLGRTHVRVDLARAHLLYGEWLRRERRRLDAREQLRTAYEMFSAIGAEGFAERAARELLATGGTARKRVIGTGTQLTAQEAQVARLAHDGLSNAEIGARLFISPHTAQHHLRKVFTKLDISSRTQLGGALPSDASAVI